MHARDMSLVGFSFKMSRMEKIFLFLASAIQNIIIRWVKINLAKWST